MNTKKIKIEGLTNLDLLELKEEIDQIEFEKEGSDEMGHSDHYNEPVSTTAIVLTLAPQILGLVAIWLAKAKEKKKRILAFEEIKADGSTKKLYLEEKDSKSGETSESTILKFLESVAQ